MWNCSVIDTPMDGSCFFNAITIALNDPDSSWQNNENLREIMEKHWNKYNQETNETPHGVNADMIRFMSSEHLDEDSLSLYNAEAEYRKETEKEKGVKIFKNLEEMKDHVRNTSCWADHSIMRAFLESLEYRCCIVIFDAEVGGMTHLPEEWTKDKDMYICLHRKLNHYRVIRLFHDTEEGERLEMPICLDRKTILEMVDFLNTTLSNPITNVF
jgi:hypothetical protein